MTKKYEVYGSIVHVLELDSIPETGDETFNVGSYPIIVWNSKIDIQSERVAEQTPHQPASRGAIGVLGTKTVLVDVEFNKESRGMTVKELAQFMLSILGCKTASIAPFEPILLHTAYLEEVAEPVQEEDMIVPGGGEVTKTKRKRKGDASEEA